MAVSAYRRRVAEMKALARLSGRDREALPELEPEDAEFWAKVRRLPDRQAQAIALFYLEDRPVSEIAKIMNCTESTAKVHLHKGRKNLAAMLGVEA
jgi:RNA polymerase sigma-70 factor (ECF subfamily)